MAVTRQMTTNANQTLTTQEETERRYYLVSSDSEVVKVEEWM